MAKQIKLMADYQSYPLWWAGTADPGNINPATLTLNAETVSRLQHWAEAYDATLNLDDPYSSGFPNEEAEEAFNIEGINLWKQLREELKPEYEVLYYSYKLGKLLIQPEELNVD
jgi:hypothetical protein